MALYVISGACVYIIVYRVKFLVPSLFLFVFFAILPFLGAMNADQYFNNIAEYYGRGRPNFEFPTFLFSIGTVSFFGGVLIGWYFPGKPKRQYIALWKIKRLQMFLTISLLLAGAGTLLAFYKIGYVPLFKHASSEERVAYAYTIGSFALRFSHHWLVPGMIAVLLYLIGERKRRYIYLAVGILSGMGTLFYAQRTGLVWFLSAFWLMYYKIARPNLRRIIAAGCLASILIYGMMLESEYRSGMYAQEGENRILKHSFFEWSQYSIVVNEVRVSGKYLGWEILVGPFLTFIPGQIFELVGADKGELMKDYSAVFYYGKQFEEPYGIRITPIGEGYAAIGIYGVIFNMVILGIFFGFLERRYWEYDIRDGRVFVVCYGIALMTHLPITSIYVIIVPMTVTGIFIIGYYLLGTQKFKSHYGISIEMNLKNKINKNTI